MKQMSQEEANGLKVLSLGKDQGSQFLGVFWKFRQQNLPIGNGVCVKDWMKFRA